jgi:hypothetical protein
MFPEGRRENGMKTTENKYKNTTEHIVKRTVNTYENTSENGNKTIKNKDKSKLNASFVVA